MLWKISKNTRPKIIKATFYLNSRTKLRVRTSTLKSNTKLQNLCFLRSRNLKNQPNMEPSLSSKNLFPRNLTPTQTKTFSINSKINHAIKRDIEDLPMLTPLNLKASKKASDWPRISLKMLKLLSKNTKKPTKETLNILNLNSILISTLPSHFLAPNFKYFGHAARGRWDSNKIRLNFLFKLPISNSFPKQKNSFI